MVQPLHLGTLPGGDDPDMTGLSGLFLWEASAGLRLYSNPRTPGGVLVRDPDRGWRVLDSEDLPGSGFGAAVEGFVGLAEFQRDYGGKSDRDFITLLYRNMLERGPMTTGWPIGPRCWDRAGAGGRRGRAKPRIHPRVEPRPDRLDARPGGGDVLEGGGSDLLQGYRSRSLYVPGRGRGGTTGCSTWNLGMCCASRGGGYDSTVAARAEFRQ